MEQLTVMLWFVEVLELVVLVMLHLVLVVLLNHRLAIAHLAATGVKAARREILLGSTVQVADRI